MPKSKTIWLKVGALWAGKKSDAAVLSGPSYHEALDYASAHYVDKDGSPAAPRFQVFPNRQREEEQDEEKKGRMPAYHLVVPLDRFEHEDAIRGIWDREKDGKYNKKAAPKEKEIVVDSLDDVDEDSLPF